MKEKYSNYYRMLLSVETFLGTKAETTGTIPAFGRAITRLNDKIAEIKGADSNRGGKSTGKSGSKNETEDKLIAAVMKAASALKTYAVDKELTDLAASVDFSKWDLIKLRDSDLAAKAGSIKKTAEGKLSELAEFGLAASDLTTIEELAATFTQLIGEMGTIRGGKIVETKNLGALIDEAKAIVEKQLDGFAETLRTDQTEFYNQYKAVRDVLDYGGSHKPGDEGTTPPPDAPTPPVS